MRRRRLAPALPLVGAACLYLACEGKLVQPGELVVAISTDMDPIRDFEMLRVVVRKGDVEVHRRDYATRGEERVTLPATLGIVAPGAPLTVTVQAVAQGLVRVERRARAVVPTGRIALLPMPVDYLCVDKTCPETQTCAAGACIDAAVSTDDLRDYEAGAVFGGESGTGQGSCFDTLSCLAGGSVLSAARDTSGGCFVPLPSHGGMGVNIALLNPPAGPGICAPDACLVPLDSDRAEGFRVEGARALLPAAVCDRALQLLVSTTCPSKTRSAPTCGPWSSVPGGGGVPDASFTPPDANVLGDGGPLVDSAGDAPADAPSPGCDTVRVATGEGFGCGLRADGRVLCAGHGTLGELGDRQRTGRVLPLPVPGLDDAVHLDVERGRTCAVRADGSVVCWGSVDSSDALATDGPVPVGNLTGAARVTIGGASHCAVRRDATLWCWGANEEGQLGDGTGTTRPNAAPVPGFTGVADVSMDSRHTCALRQDGSLWCWGANGDGELGTPDLAGARVPREVTALGRTVAQVVTTASGTCALTKDGKVWCWGTHRTGALGSPRADFTSTPIEVPGVPVARSIGAGSEHVCALTTAGEVWCWGQNDHGQLGTSGAGRLPTTATRVPGFGNDVTELFVSGRATCARRGNGRIECIGENTYGALLTGTSQFVTSPFQVPFAGPLAQVGGTEGTSCAVATLDQRAHCWGRSVDLGFNDAAPALVPRPVRGLQDELVDRFEVQGYLQAPWGCALLADRFLHCWGHNDYGQLGEGGFQQHQQAVRVSVGVKPLDGGISTTPVSGFSIGKDHSCAVLTDATLWCWGHNADGQVGTGSASSLHPTPSNVGLAKVAQVSAGAHYSCAVADGTVYCWGLNEIGQLGTTNKISARAPVSTNLGAVRHVSAGFAHTCAVKLDGSVWCWGRNNHGELGQAPGPEIATPVHVVFPVATEIAEVYAGIAANEAGYTCARSQDEKLWCWGYNERGNLGDGTFVSRSTPAEVPGMTAIGSVSTRSATCASKRDGSTWCWGANDVGQTGNGATQVNATPLSVLPLAAGCVARQRP